MNWLRDFLRPVKRCVRSNPSNWDCFQNQNPLAVCVSLDFCRARPGNETWRCFDNQTYICQRRHKGFRRCIIESTQIKAIDSWSIRNDHDRDYAQMQCYGRRSCRNWNMANHRPESCRLAGELSWTNVILLCWHHWEVLRT